MFTQEQMEEISIDRRRNPGKAGLVKVGELHGCSPELILEALGITEEEWDMPEPDPVPQKAKKTFTEEEKAAALQMIESGKSYASVAKEVGCSQQTLFGWKKKAVQGVVTVKKEEPVRRGNPLDALAMLRKISVLCNLPVTATIEELDKCIVAFAAGAEWAMGVEHEG